MRRQGGFSLVELLIVVAIILIIASIAIPSLMSARVAANEASAVSSTRTIMTAEATYAAMYPAQGYAQSLPVLGPGGGIPDSTHANLIDDQLAHAVDANHTKSGFYWTLTATPFDGTTASTGVPYTTFGLTARPKGSTQGSRSFCSDQTGVVRQIQVAFGACDGTSTILGS